MSIELQQRHFEQHSTCLEQCRTGRELRNEQKVEETEKGHEDHGEHCGEGDQFIGSTGKCSSEQGQTMMILAELQKPKDRQESTTGR